MGNVFADLPIPAGPSGAGAAVDTSSMDSVRTIGVSGSFSGTVTVEGSQDGVNFCAITTYASPTKSVLVAAVAWMRVRVRNFSGSANADVGAADGGIATSLAIPIPPGNGTGAPVDVSELGTVTTIIATGTLQGVLTLESSEDGIDWAAVASGTGPFCKTVNLIAQFVRVRLSNFTSGAPVVDLGSADDATGVAGGSFAATVCTTPGVTNVFVDAVSGNDDNSGLSAGSALKTIGAVYRKFGTETQGDCEIVVNLADDGSGGVADYVINTLLVNSGIGDKASFRYVGPPMVAFPPSTGPSTAILDATPADTVDQDGVITAAGGRSRLNFVGASPGWTIDDLKGGFVRVTRAGALVFFELPITKNDADHIFVDAPAMSATILQTDTVEIVHPGARISDSIGSFNIKGLGLGLTFITAEQKSITRIALGGSGFGFGAANDVSVGFDRVLFNKSLFAFHLNLDISNSASFNAVFGGVFLEFSSTQGSRPSFGTVIDAGPQTMWAGVLHASLTLIGADIQMSAARGISVWDSGGPSEPALSLFSGRLRDAGAFIQGINPAAPEGIGLVDNAGAVVAGGTKTTLTGVADIKVGGLVVPYGTGVGGLEEVAGFAGNATSMNRGTAAAPLGDASNIRTSTLI